MANNADSKTSLNDAVAILGIAGVLILAGLIAWFYGTGNETSAAGLLNTVVPVVGTIVGLVFGVSYGSKSGTAQGQKAGAAAGTAKAHIATKSLSENGEALRRLKSNLTDHKDAHKRHAEPVAHALARENAPQSDVHKLSEEHVTEIINQIDTAITKNDTALHLISD